VSRVQGSLVDSHGVRQAWVYKAHLWGYYTWVFPNAISAYFLKSTLIKGSV
jgi:hypothetical protein